MGNRVSLVLLLWVSPNCYQQSGNWANKMPRSTVTPVVGLGKEPSSKRAATSQRSHRSHRPSHATTWVKQRPTEDDEGLSADAAALLQEAIGRQGFLPIAEVPPNTPAAADPVGDVAPTEHEAAAKATRRVEEEAAAALGFDEAATARLLQAMSAAAEWPPHMGPEALLDSVASGAIAPLKGSWLVALEARGGRLARRQDLPAEAFFSAAELRRLVEALGDDYGLLFVALSYRYAPAHADRTRLTRSARCPRSHPWTLRCMCRGQVAEQGPPGPGRLPSDHRRGGGAAVHEWR